MRKSLLPARAKTTLYIPADLHRAAKVYAARHGTTITQLIIDGLRARLKERPAEEAGN